MVKAFLTETDADEDIFPLRDINIATVRQNTSQRTISKFYTIKMLCFSGESETTSTSPFGACSSSTLAPSVLDCVQLHTYHLVLRIKISGSKGLSEPPICSRWADRAQNFPNDVAPYLCVCTEFDLDRLRLAGVIPKD